MKYVGTPDLSTRAHMQAISGLVRVQFVITGSNKVVSCLDIEIGYLQTCHSRFGPSLTQSDHA